MTLLEDHIRKRTAQKGHLTRIAKELNRLCDTKPVDEDVLDDILIEFDNRLTNIEEIQSDIELLVEENELDQCIQEFRDYEDKIKIVRFRAIKLLRSIKKEKTLPDNHSQHSLNAKSSNGKVSARLPKINLPTFRGDIKQWTPFWDQFKVVIDDTDLPDVTKFTYLNSVLSDEARSSIQGLSLTTANYNTAKAILIERYGKKERIIASHIDALLHITVPESSRVGGLWELLDDIQAHVRALGNLDVGGEQYGVLLTPIILSRLPQDLRLEWAREEGHEGELEYLLTFLKGEIGRRERSSPVISTPHEQNQSGSATALLLTSKVKKTDICVICNKSSNHKIGNCYALTKFSPQEIRDKLRENHSCFKCLSTDGKHNYKKCRVACGLCGSGRHHAILCDRKESVQDQGMIKEDKKQPANKTKGQGRIVVNSHTNLTQSEKHDKSNVLLQVVRVKVTGKTGQTEAVVMFDTGANRSYVSQKLIDKIGPEWICSEEIACATFGNTTAGKTQHRNVYQLGMSGIDKDLSISVTEIPTICAALHKPAIPKQIIDQFKGQLNVIQSDEGKLTIDILIGVDWYWHLVSGESKSLSESLTAQRTIFGWMISGMIENNANKSKLMTHNLLCLDMNESLAHKFWDLESIGIKPNEEPTEDAVLNKFDENIKYQEGRYVVELPWKDDKISEKIVNNYKLSETRLERLKGKLEKTPELKEKYQEAISTMEKAGIIEEVPNSEMNNKEVPIYYMPHRPVIKESSQTTKVRPVFDASAKSHNGVSLNDCLETGPNLIPELPGVLMRFCRWKIAILADINKAFLMVGVKKEDQDVHRFLWDDHGSMRVMRFTRVPFGNKSSMFLLIATIRHHLSKYQDSITTNEIKENMYVDNWITGCDEIEEACERAKEAKDILHEAGMTLSQWGSNCKQVGLFVKCEFEEKCSEEDSIKVLGLKWIASEDIFVYECIEVPLDICLTKRLLLGYISRLFDPLGFALPYIMTARILFQSIWKINIDWNDIVPDSINECFQKWILGLNTLSKWRIPRRFTSVPWKEIEFLEIHVFGDASNSGYGACAYVRALTTSGQWSVKLAMARARVAPMKQITLPRLELLGALLCARLAVLVLKELNIEKTVVAHCWTDSTVTLAWIKSDPLRWKLFVKNRVSEIQDHIPPECWHHCQGKDNPADLITRGISAETLISSKNWLHGPEFLKESIHSWPKEVSQVVPVDMEQRAKQLKGERKIEEKEEKKQKKGQSKKINEQSKGERKMEKEVREEERGEKEQITINMVTISPETNQLFPVERWSSWAKAIRVVSFVLRFISKMKKSLKETSGELSYNELSKAKTVLLIQCQKTNLNKEYKLLSEGQTIPKSSSIFKLNPKLEKDGLMRVQSRLGKSYLSSEEVSPIIVPKSHESLLITRHTHKLHKHAGVNAMLVYLRNQYWIIRARVTCKKVKGQCISCRRQDSKSIKETMAPLPEVRVKPTPSFAITGMDHGGPLYCCNHPGKKFYILLFTCAVTRALHLELVDSLSGETTIMAIRRFIARRGMPSIFMSDNAKGFKAAADKLMISFGNDGPRWRFIAPLSPWWGGWWERLMGSVKQALRKSVGKRNLTLIELETNLLEIEMVLNSRPLTFVGDALEDGKVLTPAHFLIGRQVMSKPTSLEENTNDSFQTVDLISRWEAQNEALDEFWVFWYDNYLKNLPTVKGTSNKSGIQVGEIVLIHVEGSPRLQWPLGLVQKLLPGIDGLTRAVELKTKKGTLTRSIQRLHRLEIVQVQDTLPATVNETEQMQDILPPTVNEIEQVQNTLTPTVNENCPNKKNTEIVTKSRSGRIIRPKRDNKFDYN